MRKHCFLLPRPLRRPDVDLKSTLDGKLKYLQDSPCPSLAYLCRSEKGLLFRNDFTWGVLLGIMHWTECIIPQNMKKKKTTKHIDSISTHFPFVLTNAAFAYLNSHMNVVMIMLLRPLIEVATSFKHWNNIKV